MSPETPQLPRELNDSEMNMPAEGNALRLAANRLNAEARPVLEAVKSEVARRDEQVKFLQEHLGSLETHLSQVQKALELGLTQLGVSDLESTRQMLEGQIQAIRGQIEDIGRARTEAENIAQGQKEETAIERGRLREVRDVTSQLEAMRSEWKSKKKELEDRFNDLKAGNLHGMTDERAGEVMLEIQDEIRRLDQDFGKRESDLMDRFRFLDPDLASRYATGTVNIGTDLPAPGLDVGGGLPLSGQAEGGDSAPLGEHTADEQAIRDAAELAEQQAAEAPSIEGSVNEVEPPVLPTVPEIASEDSGANMDNEGRVENPPPVELPGQESPAQEAVAEEPGTDTSLEATASQAVATPESSRYATEPIVARFGTNVNALGSAEAQQAADERDTANRYLNELGVHLGGLDGQLVRRELVSFLGSEATDAQINWVAQNTLDTATKLGLTRNGGESVADYFQRVADIAERSNMSLVDKIRAIMPDVQIVLPRLEVRLPRFGERPKSVQEIKDELAALDRGEHPDQLVGATGYRKVPLSGEQIAAIRQRLNRELEAAQRRETETQPRESLGGRLWGWFKNLRNVPGDVGRRIGAEIDTRAFMRQQEQERQQEANQELGRRLDQMEALNNRVREFANRGELFTAGAIDALLNTYRTFFEVARLNPDQRRQYVDILNRTTEEIPVVVIEGTGDQQRLRLEWRDLTVTTNTDDVRSGLEASLRAIRDASPQAQTPGGERRGALDLQGVLARSSQPLEQRFGPEIAALLNNL